MNKTVEGLLILFSVGFFIGLALMALRRRMRPAPTKEERARKKGFDWQTLAQKVHSEKVEKAPPYQAPRTPDHEHSKWAPPQSK